MSVNRPPGLARLLLRLMIPRAHREFVLGDLEEEFAQIARESGGAARKWYWRQAVASITWTSRGPAPSNTTVPTGGRLLHSVGQDVRFAVRSFGRRPLFTAAALVTLALGVGATTAVFGFANAVLFRPIPGVRDADRLGIVWFGRQSSGGGISVAGVSYPNLDDLNAQLTAFEPLAGYQPGGAHVAAADANPERLGVQFVTPSFFAVLGVQPILGRTFTADEDDPVQGGVPVTVISHRLWIRLFDGTPDVLEGSLRINGLPFDVIGVLPEGFHGTERLDDTDLWFPGTTLPYVNHFPAEFSNYADRGRGGYYSFVARLAPGATWGDAEAELRAASARLAELHPGVNDKFTEGVQPFVYPGIGVMPLAKSGTVSTFNLLFGIVALILLIACANVANLLLFRAVTRRGERAVRTALGATRRRLVRQHLTENLLLWIAGGIAGLGVAWLTVRIFHGTQLFAVRVQDVAIDWRVAGFALAASLVTGLIFGLLPAVFAPSTELVAALKDAARTETGKRALVRSGLTVLQMAATVTLLVGALLFVRTLLELGRVELGFDPRGVTTAIVNPGDQGYDQAELAPYYYGFVQRLEASPGVAAAAVSTGVPFSPGFITRIRSADAPDDATPFEPLLYQTTVGLREALGLPLLRGRWFTEDEVLPPEGRPDGVAVVSAELASQLFATDDPIGRYVEFATMGREDHRLRIVGVVGDLRWRDVDGPIEPILFEPFGQRGRVDGDAYILSKSVTGAPTVGEMRRIARELDAALPIVRPMTLSEAVRANLSARRMFANLLTLLGALAITLAAVGLYGVVAFAVAARTREFGVRMAMGADTGTILLLVLRRGLVLVALGVVVGLGGAVVLSKTIESRLFGVTALDPISYLLAVGVLAAVALVATWIPARRATRVDPMTALRYE
jgi:putative ABC transport system permease protein